MTQDYLIQSRRPSGGKADGFQNFDDVGQAKSSAPCRQRRLFRLGCGAQSRGGAVAQLSAPATAPPRAKARTT
jgi:hypothetical protein